MILITFDESLKNINLFLKAWDGKSDKSSVADDDDKKPNFKTSYDIVVDYSEYSTIQVTNCLCTLCSLEMRLAWSPNEKEVGGSIETNA